MLGSLIFSKLQSAKILLLPSKYEIMMVLPDKFSLAPCNIITLSLNPLYILFVTSSLLLFWWFPFLSYRSSNYRDRDSCRSFLLLKAIALRLPLLFANAFKSNIGKIIIFKGYQKLFCILMVAIIFSPTVYTL